MKNFQTDIFENDSKDIIEKTKRIICAFKDAESFPKDLSFYLDTYHLDDIIEDTSILNAETSDKHLENIKKLSRFWLGVSLFANDFNNSDNFNEFTININSNFSDLVKAAEKTVLNKDNNIFPFVKNLSITYYSNKDTAILLNDYKLFFEAIIETVPFIEC